MLTNLLELTTDLVEPLPEIEELPEYQVLGQVATFGLVHGAGHGAWCWEYLVEELNDTGYKAVTVDLPIDNPQLTSRDYAECAADVFRGLDNLVVVGHSMAGVVIPQVAEMIPVKKLVYLNGALRQPGRSLDEPSDFMPQRNSQEFLDSIIRISGNMARIPREAAIRLFYNDCHAEVANWAADNLRDQSMDYWHEKAPEQKPPELASEYILSENDKVINPDWARIAAGEWLGVEPVEIDSDHSPFLSNPHLLAKTLISLT